MLKDNKKVIFLSAVICFFAFLLLVAYVVLGAPAFPAATVALMDAIAILLILIATMAFLLRNSLRKTLYAFKNIALIGCILFSSVLVIVLLVFLFRFFRTDAISLPNIFKAIVRFPQQFSYYALFVIIAINALVGISNVVLIKHEGFCLNNALSLIVALFYIGSTFAVYFLCDLLTKKLLVPHGGRFEPIFLILHIGLPMFLMLILCYFEAILAGTAIMGFITARHKAAYDKDYIIILGCSIDRRGGLLPLLKGRVNSAVRFAWDQEIACGKAAKYVPSGGQGANEIMSEGSAMELYLLTHGAEDYEVFPEKKSTNTFENMLFSKRVIDSLQPGAKIAFATTNYHILRSGILARYAGFDAEAIAGDTKWYFWPNGFVREFFGILRMSLKFHLLVSALLAVLCSLVGLFAYLGNLI